MQQITKTRGLIAALVRRSPVRPKEKADLFGLDFYGARFSRGLRARSSAALTVNRTVIHYRSPSRPCPFQKKKQTTRVCFFFWSGLRGSNPPPPPWQGGALPNELNPHIKLATRMGLGRGANCAPWSPSALTVHWTVIHYLLCSSGSAYF